MLFLEIGLGVAFAAIIVLAAIVYSALVLGKESNAQADEWVGDETETGVHHLGGGFYTEPLPSGEWVIYHDGSGRQELATVSSLPDAIAMVHDRVRAQ